MPRAFSKILIIIIATISIVGGFFAWQKFGAPKEEVVQGEVTDWQTFSISGLGGFQFKYPSYYKIDSGIQEHKFSDTRDIKNMRFTLVFYDVNINDFDDEYKSFGSKIISVGGKEVIYYSLGEHNQLIKTYFIPLKELRTLKITTITTEYGSLSFEDQSKLFDQILSTFRFLE